MGPLKASRHNVRGFHPGRSGSPLGKDLPGPSARGRLGPTPAAASSRSKRESRVCEPALPKSLTYRRLRLLPKKADTAGGSGSRLACLRAMPDAAPRPLTGRTSRLPSGLKGAPCRRSPCPAKAGPWALLALASRASPAWLPSGPARQASARRASARRARPLPRPALPRRALPRRPLPLQAWPLPPAYAQVPCALRASVPRSFWRCSFALAPFLRSFFWQSSCGRLPVLPSTYGRQSCARSYARCAPSSARSCVDLSSYSLCASSHSFS